MNDMKRAAAITGIGELAPSKKTEKLPEDLIFEAAKLAIADAGLERKDIDGLLITPPMSSLVNMAVPGAYAEMLGFDLHYANIVDMAGASGASQVLKAAAAIAAGHATHILCLTGDAQNPAAFNAMMRRGRVGLSFFGHDYEEPYGAMGAPSGYALAATRHQYEYGVTPEMRARIAVDQRTNACANPDAMFYGKSITVEDVLATRIVSWPFHLLEIVMPVSGAAAFVVSAPEAAKKMPHPPAWYLGGAEKLGTSSVAQVKDILTTPISYTGPAAFERAGVTPADVDVVEVYDCFTTTVLLTLEDAGFCEKGKSGHFVMDHDLTYKGDLPVNTHGGQLSFGQAGLAGGTSHVTEAVRQLRHEAGERQVSDVEIAFVNGNGGILAEQCSLVLSNS